MTQIWQLLLDLTQPNSVRAPQHSILNSTRHLNVHVQRSTSTLAQRYLRHLRASSREPSYQTGIYRRVRHRGVSQKHPNDFRILYTERAVRVAGQGQYSTQSWAAGRRPPYHRAFVLAFLYPTPTSIDATVLVLDVGLPSVCTTPYVPCLPMQCGPL